MKLSDLVSYKNSLDQLSTSQTKRTVDLDLSNIKHLIDNQNIQIEDFAEQIDSQYQNILQEIEKFDQHLTNLKQSIDREIEVAAKPWFQESYRLYEEEMCYETVEYILNRRLSATTEAEIIMRSRLHNYSSWQHPGMIIRPGLESFISDLVSFDPLYVIDQSHDLLKPAIEQFPLEYQRRLRPYTIAESIEHNMLDKIPNSQFGICFVYNYFNYRPLEFIKKMLDEIYHKLKPGGILIMTFNDCDRYNAVKLVEQHFCCYTPGSLIKALAYRLGYEKIFEWHEDGSSTWIEFKKPGKLETIRGGQTLARILPKELAQSK